MRWGIAGHQVLEGEEDWRWVEDALRAFLLASADPVEGVSSLAIGADQLFARLALERGGALRVVIPFPDYERTFDSREARTEYRRLLAEASHVEILPERASDQESFFAAGKRVVEWADILFTVWDGEAAKGLGGTADVVRHAQATGKSVIHLNPQSRQVRAAGEVEDSTS